MSLNFKNSVIIRKKPISLILKGIDDDTLVEDPKESGVGLFILANGDGSKAKELKKALEKMGVYVELEVLPCG